MWLGDADTTPDSDAVNGLGAEAPAAVERTVDERIDHGVGHTEEEDPQNVAVFDVAHVDEGVDDEDDLVRCPADDEGRHNDGRHTERLYLRLGEQTIAYSRLRSSVTLHFHVLR